LCKNVSLAVLFGNMERAEGHLQGGGRQNRPEKRKEEWAQLDVSRHVEDRGEQAKHENGRKLGRSKKLNG
jgi:hypothetical protein